MPLKIGTHGPMTVPARTGADAARTSSAARRRYALRVRVIRRIARRSQGLVCAVLIIITCDRVARVGCVISIIVNFGQSDVTVSKTGYAFGIAIEGRVVPACFAFVPGKGGV